MANPTRHTDYDGSAGDEPTQQTQPKDRDEHGKPAKPITIPFPSARTSRTR
jgi:hypothetical protein